MKIAWKLIAVMAVAAFAYACQKFESAPQFSKSTGTLSVSASTTAIAVAAADSLSPAVTLTWNDPQYSVGLANTKFMVLLSPAGSNFATAVTKSFTGVTKGSLSGKEINGMALRLGGTVGEAMALDLKVVSSHQNNDEPLNSNTLAITVTPPSDLNLSATSLAVICAAATSGQNADTLSWSVAFNGFSGVKTYQLQYAKGGTAFAAPTIVDMAAFSKTFTQLDLNKIALGFGTPPGTAGDVDFRVRAANETGAVVYSNTVTVNVTTYVANNSIGIIGDATPGSWSTDTDMWRPDPVNSPGAWTVTLKLIGGKSAKFRADDLWDNNWGDTAFPSGTGTQNGPNIPVNNTGYYKVDFNAGTGVYVFTPLAAPTFTNISLIGAVVGTTFPADAWSVDWDLTQDGTDPHLWTGTYTFASDGDVKLRANHAWGTNWGDSKFPSGYGVGNGPNIPAKAGTYFIRFNDVSGEFFFGRTTDNAATPYTLVAIIGDATPNGWGGDSPLIQNPINPYKWSGKYTLVGPNKYAKFRADGAWTVNWGDTNWPKSIGTQNGPNIPATAGTYQINFNSATGEYTFEN